MRRPSKDRYKKQQQRRLWLIAEVVAVVVFLVLLGVIVRRLAARAHVSEEEASASARMQAIAAAVDPVESEAPAESSRPLPSARPIAQAPPEVFDYFKPLLEVNPEIVGLVGFGDEQSRYVCQADDNVYYMTHRFDGSEDPGGMVFLDARCSVYPQSDNTILYGHNMRDGSRFGLLNRYKESAHLAEHPRIRFASLYEMNDYYPFAVLLTSVDPGSEAYFDFAVTDFASEAAFDAYVEAARWASIYPLPLEVRYGDKLLTMATCSEEEAGGRLVIISRAVRPEGNGKDFR